MVCPNLRSRRTFPDNRPIPIEHWRQPKWQQVERQEVEPWKSLLIEALGADSSLSSLAKIDGFYIHWSMIVSGRDFSQPSLFGDQKPCPLEKIPTHPRLHVGLQSRQLAPKRVRQKTSICELFRVRHHGKEMSRIWRKIHKLVY